MPRDYAKQISGLKGVLEEQIEALHHAQSVNAALRERERALSSLISSACGGVEAIKLSLIQNSKNNQKQGLGESSDGKSSSSASLSTVTPESSTRAIYSDVSSPSNELLENLVHKEQLVQQALSRLGVKCEYEELYTTQILRKLAANPARQQQLSSRTTADALHGLKMAFQRFSMLLPRYDAEGPLDSKFNTKEQVDDLIDAAIEGTLFRGFLEYPRRNTAWLMTNMETGEPEPYPEGWFKRMVTSMCMTPEQKAQLKVSWDKGKVDKGALLKRHEELAQQLLLLQQQQAADREQFLQQTHCLVDKCTHVAEVLRLHRNGGSSQHSTPATPQQQQQQHQGSSQQQQEQGWSQQREQQRSSKQQQQRVQAQAPVLDRVSSGFSSDSSGDALTGLSCVCLAYTYSQEQQRIEAEMEEIISQINLLWLVQGMQIYNTMSRKQLALGVVYAYPFAPDPIQGYQALEDMGW